MKETNQRFYRQYLEQEKDSARIRLIKTAKSLEDNMHWLAKRLEKGDQVVSELGEVQSQASSVDTACARYTMARRALEEFDNFVAASFDD
jgi:hypothetical protein